MNTTRENWRIVWGLVVVALLVSVVGSIFNLYDEFWWYDKAAHGYAWFAYTLALALLAYGVVLTGARDHRLLLILTVGGIGLAIGALWEVAEWTYDQFVRPNAILGKTDTILDLVTDAAGSLVAGYVFLRMLKK